MFHRVSAAIAICLVIGFCSWLLLVRNKRSLFDLCQLHILGYFVFAVLGLLAYDFLYSRPTPGDFWLIALASATSIIITVVTYLRIGKRLAAVSPKPPLKKPTSVVCAVMLVWAVGTAGYTFRILFTGGSLGDFLTAVYSNRAQIEGVLIAGPLAQACGAAFFVALASVLLARRRRNGRAGFLLVTVLFLTGITELYLCLTSLNRSRFAIDLLAILYIATTCGYVRKKKWIVLGCLGIAATLFFLNPIILNVRYLGWYDYVSLGGDSTFLSSLRTSQSTGSMDFFLLIKDTIPGQHPYMSGRTMIPIVLAFVPRALWPGKPLPFGRYVWSDLIGESTLNGVGPTFIGEAYANAGWLGIGVFSVGLGAFLALVERWIAQRPVPDERIALKASILFWWSVMLVRGDMHTCIVFGGISFVTVWLGFRIGSLWSHLFAPTSTGPAASQEL